jgi:hypothetical protein
MRAVSRRLYPCLPLSAALLAGCLNNVVTLAQEDAGATALASDATAVGRDVPGARADVPSSIADVPSASADLPTATADLPTATADVPPSAAEGAGSVDLLVVIDSSNSMRAGQDYFNNYANALVGTLIDVHRVRDVRVGVITTDLGVGGRAIPSCTAARGDDAVLNPRARGAATRARNPGDPPVPTFCDAIAAAPFMTLRAADDPMYRYWAPSCHAAVGIGGCGLEQPLEAALRALTTNATPNAVNAGFLRRDAALAVLVVSDEDDGSVRDCHAHDGVGACVDATDVWDPGSTRWSSADLNLRFYNYVPGSTEDPTWPVDRYVDPQRLRRGLLGLKPDHPERVLFAAVTGVPRTLPLRADGSTDWRALLGGADGRDGFTAMTADGPVSMRAANPDPACSARVVPACRVPGGDPRACDLAGQGYAWPARRLAEVARRLDEAPLCAGAPCGNGMVASICDTGNADPLTRFAGLIARRVVR